MWFAGEAKSRSELFPDSEDISWAGKVTAEGTSRNPYWVARGKRTTICCSLGFETNRRRKQTKRPFSSCSVWISCGTPCHRTMWVLKVCMGSRRGWVETNLLTTIGYEEPASRVEWSRTASCQHRKSPWEAALPDSSDLTVPSRVTERRQWYFGPI